MGVLARVEENSLAGQHRNTQEERLFRAELLVRSGQSAEAVRLGKQWILQWREPWLANRLLRTLALEGPAVNAGEFGDAVMAINPEIRFYVAHELASEGAHSVAAHLLQNWIHATPTASMNEIAGFLTACRELNEPAIVWTTFGGLLQSGASNEMIGRFSEAVAAEFGIGALAPFWNLLPAAVLDSRPLLEARLAFYEQQTDLARSLIQRISPVALGASDQQIWLDLVLAVSLPADAFALLNAFFKGGSLPTALLPKYAVLAGGLGQEAAFQEALSMLAVRAP